MKNLFLFFFLSLSLLHGQTLTFTIQNVTGSNSITCTTPSINLVANSNFLPAPSFTWSSPGATLSGISVTLTSPGTYTIFASSGSVTANQTLSVLSNTVVPNSIISPTFQNINCTFTSVTTVTALAVTPTNNILHQFMSPNGGTLSAGTTFAFSHPMAPGTYTHVLQDLSNGCNSIKTFTVASTQAFPTFSIVSIPSQSLGCASKSITTLGMNGQSTYTPGGPISYTILAPGMSSATAAGTLVWISTYTVNVPGTWTLITKDNTNFCESRVQISIIQNTVSPPFTYTASSYTLNCYNSPLVLTASSTKTNTAILWTYPNLIGPGTNPTAIYASNTTNTLNVNFTLTVWDNENACFSNTIVPIFYNTVAPVANNPTPFPCPDPTVQVYAHPIGVVHTYSWTSPAGAVVSGVQGPTLTTNTPGNYTIVYTNTISGCSDPALIHVEQCVGIRENGFGNEDFHFYPNPVKDLLHLKCVGSPAGETIILIRNIVGENVLTYKISAPEFILDLGNLQSGFYFLRVGTLGGKGDLKFLKE